jgi:hypothetical protein
MNHEINPIISGLYYIPLWAIHGVIIENKRAVAEVKREFNHVYKDRILDN